MDGECTSIECYFAAAKQRATWFNRSENRWVCLRCAQEANIQAYRHGIKYKTEVPKPCITSAQKMMEILQA